MKIPHLPCYILLLTLSGCATSSSTKSTAYPVTALSFHPAQEKLNVVIVTHNDKSDDITPEIVVLKDELVKTLQQANLFASVGEDNATATLTVTILHLKKVDALTRTMIGLMAGPARISIDYALSDSASGTIYRTGHIAAQSDNLGALNGVTTQAFTTLSQKLVQELK